MNFDSKDYLPKSRERIEHLRKIIDGRPVVILAAGSSIKELEKRIAELRKADICYFGLNNFSLQEVHILQQIERHFSVTMCSAREHMAKHIKKITDFLNRDDANIFVSSFWRNTFELMGDDFDLNQFLSKYDEKLIFFSLSLKRTVPNSNSPLHFIQSNSLLALIQLAIIGKASKIALFGADGYCKANDESYYYNQCGSDNVRKDSVIDDTNKYFNPLAPIATRNVYTTYNLAPIEILNCSQDSACTPFPKVSYDDAFEYLLNRKKFNRLLDLRVPKVSVISFCFCADSIKETIENILQQSYVNNEHIFIYSEANDKIKAIKQQFPLVRWIPVKNMNYLQALKNAISMARGEYILQCNIGNVYLNQDWLNTCVEILENNPDISLVWSLSQNILKDGMFGQVSNVKHFYDAPSQGKDYIYYWLKKKTVFPKGNLCVRKRVLEECFQFDDSEGNNEHKAWLIFNYRFNVSGYLPFFIPEVVNYSITCDDMPFDFEKLIAVYRRDIENYKRKLVAKKTIHRYRNGNGKFLKGVFSNFYFLFFDLKEFLKFTLFNIVMRIKHKLPKTCCVIIDKILFFWRAYKLNMFNVAIARIRFRLIRIGK